MSAFEELIKKDFSFLFDQYAFTLIPNELDRQESAYYAIAIAQGGGVRLRFIRDRADFFLDVGVAEKPSVWCDVYKVLSRLKTNGFVNEDIKPLHKPAAIRKVLLKYIDLITAASRAAVHR